MMRVAFDIHKANPIKKGGSISDAKLALSKAQEVATQYVLGLEPVLEVGQGSRRVHVRRDCSVTDAGPWAGGGSDVPGHDIDAKPWPDVRECEVHEYIMYWSGGWSLEYVGYLAHADALASSRVRGDHSCGSATCYRAVTRSAIPGLPPGDWVWDFSNERNQWQ